MISLAARTVLYRRGRLLMTVLSIVLGVGFMTATLAMSDSIEKGTDETFASVATSSDLVVRNAASFADSDLPEVREPMPTSALDAIEAIEGVDAAVGAVSGDGILGITDGDGWTTTAIIYSADGIGTVSPFHVAEGREPEGPDEILLDVSTARAEDIEIGDEVSLQAAKAVQATVVGLAAMGDVEGVPGIAVVLPALPMAQDLLGRPDDLDEILVRSTNGIDGTELARRVEQAGPAGIEAITSEALADERADASHETSSMVTLLLGGFSVIALFVGGFVILNTFTVVMAQRTRETGLLRALGASSRQVTRAVLVEAIFVGGIASAIGTAVGIAMAGALRWFTEALDLQLPDGGLVLSARTLILPVVIGVGLTVLATYIPARRAGRLAPMAALRDVDRRVTVSRIRVVAGIVLAVLSPALGILGIPAAMIAAALLAPALVPIAARLASPALRRVGGMAGRLGAENAIRNPRRTGATSSALMVGLALVFGMTVMADSMLSSFTDTLDRSVRADLIVTPETGDGLAPELAGGIAELPEVGSVARQRYGQLELVGIDGESTPEESGTQELLAVDADTYADAFDLDLSEGHIADLNGGGVIVLDEIADRQGWQVGDSIGMRFAKAGEQQLEIAGIYTDGTLENQGFVISMDRYEEFFTDQLDTRVFVTSASGHTAEETEGAVQAFVEQYPGVDVFTEESYIDEVASVIDVILGAVNLLLGLSVVIAVLGIINTLALSMHERTRELGLVRAVGMSKEQVRAMVRWESLIMSMLGSFSAMIVGLVVGRALLGVIGSRFGDQITLPVGRLALFLLFGVFLGIAAAAFPARNAAKTPILDAIRTT